MSSEDFLTIVAERGFVHQCTDEDGLRARLKDAAVTGYIGFDCTAPSLHVGSLLPIMLLRWFQKTGNKPIVLMGGGTTRIGDPSGKDSARQLLDDGAIAANMAGIKTVFEKFLSFGDGAADAVMVDNADWLDTLAYIPFLRQVGRHFSINRMLSFDSVRLRLEREQPLSFLEFNYMILQAYDFLELSRRSGCALQMGGSDQWGNIVNGVELIRRVDGKEAFGLTTPLMTTASGAKMGKTADGAVWLNADMRSPYDYWQFWRNTEDGDVGRFLRLFTELPLDECARLGTLGGADINDAKKVLATEATALLHGRAAAEAARDTAQQTFEQGALGADLPVITVTQADLDAGIGVCDAFRMAGLTKSNGEARKAVANNAISVNDAKVDDPRVLITNTDLTADGVIKLSFGRKRHVLIKPS
jgi:tyrosyl-tRNA synthetase